MAAKEEKNHRMHRRMLRNISVRLLLNGVVITLSLLVVALTVVRGWDAYQRRVEAVRLSVMNEMADKIIASAAYEALERGITASALAGGEGAGADTVNKIKEFRTKGDEALKGALEIAEKLAVKEPDSRFATLYEQAGQAYRSLVDARKRVDSSLQGGRREIEPFEWFQVMAEVIDRAAALRQAAFASGEPLQQITQDNLILKQAVWLISENMGRERGTLGPIIASQKPIPQDVMEDLRAYRAIVDLGVADILSIKREKGADPRIVNAIWDMEKALRRFNETRMEVYSALVTGNYPLSPLDWIGRSTEAIDKVLAVSKAVTEVNNDKANAAAKECSRSLLLALFQVCGTLLFLFLVLMLVYDKTSRIERLYESMNQLAKGEGDLTFRLDAASNDEVGKTAGAFNSFMNHLQEIINQVRKTTDQLASSTTELSAMSDRMSTSSADQKEQSIHVASAIEEMSRSVAEVARNASEVAQFSKEANEMADEGGKVVHGAICGMEKIARSVMEGAAVIEALGTSSKQIGEIVSVIDNIAEQTNLLALNAAIEAARASEQGKGFAVVADEVRKLAERTTKATSQIAAMIKTIQGDIQKAVATMNESTAEVESGVALANEAGQTLRQIVEDSQKVMDMIQQIAVAAEEQSSVSSDIAGNVEKISQLSKEGNSAASQTAQASEDLMKLATGLQQMVSRFKV